MNLYTDKIREFFRKLFKKNKEENKQIIEEPKLQTGDEINPEEEYTAKILSPTQMVLKRFFRSKLSVIGLSMIIGLFLFSFVGPLFSPYEELEADIESTEIQIIPTIVDVTIKKDDVYDINFTADSYIYQNYEVSRYNNYLRLKLSATIGESFNIILNGSKYNAIQKNYTYIGTGNDDEIVLDLTSFSALDKASIENIYIFGKANTTLKINEVKFLNDTLIENAESLTNSDYELTEYEEALSWQGEYATINSTKGESITNTTYSVTFSSQKTNILAYPSSKHWLGTDSSGYDILSRCMYGGRISLKIAFIVVILETIIGVIFGCLAGYFGKWVDMIIMRVVDIFYCIPTLPILMIVSAVLTQNNVEEGVRIYYMMIFMCLLGWAGTARMVRGQILMLREQEYMTAARAMGLSVPRQIIKHLIPNVMPQLIVSMTLGLGSVILTESTLSFLGIGVPVPYAAWGTMISGMQKTEILNEHFHAWGPPGLCIMLVVLGFNFVGDGLRDAFDPKSKR